MYKWLKGLYSVDSSTYDKDHKVTYKNYSNYLLHHIEFISQGKDLLTPVDFEELAEMEKIEN